ncbi:MAG: squalene/phytoene synthase family protein [Deltaproteobacteria bacterium]|nr:squalene/phytoene synthase family protein [Deltaproteobacteria bacterium]
MTSQTLDIRSLEHRRFDALVVGCGPVGAIAARALARQGQRVLVIEANPRASRRLAGEWLHPRGAEILEQLELVPVQREPAALRPKGFVVFPDDHSDAIQLPYANGQRGLTFEHYRLVERLRQALKDDGRITVVERMRFCGMADGKALLAQRNGQRIEISCRRVIGADGRRSSVRKLSSDDSPSHLISMMAGAVLPNVTLPYEAFGHVILGGPGPVLAYRIDPQHVRMILDVPLVDGKPALKADELPRFYGPHLPRQLAEGLRQQVAQDKLTWGTARFAPRYYYGSEAAPLVGDAAGHFHPLTAAGITLGAIDAATLAESTSFSKWARSRERDTYAPELLSNALYHVFLSQHEGAKQIRQAIFASWRKSAGERSRTMELLGLEQTRRRSFARAFTAMTLRAVRHVARQARSEQPSWLRVAASRCQSLGPWARWPAAVAIAGPLRRYQRKFGQPSDPFAGHWPLSAQTDRPLGETATDHDWQSCVEQLERVSRSFAVPISMLPNNLRRATTCGYLLCRIADTIEDRPDLGTEHRERLFGRFLALIESDAPSAQFTSDLAQTLGDAASDHEVRLALDVDRVIRVLRTVPAPMEATCRRWVAEMARGMNIYAHRELGPDGMVALTTPADLERYCYFVAGTVGHMLTELFVAEIGSLDADRQLQLRENAEAFGMGLQLVNILKDVTDDRARNWSFIPRTACQRLGLSAADLVHPERRQAAHQAVAPIFQTAKEQLDRAVDYTVAIPAEQHYIRLFCLIPLLMAARTLTLARGNDAMFVPGEPVKISRQEVGQTVADAQAICGSDQAIRKCYADLWEPTSATGTDG